MNIDKCRAALKAAEEQSVEAVWQASMNAGENAGQTMIDQGRKDERFIFSCSYSDDMMVYWAHSLIGIMSESDCDPAVQEFFARFDIVA